MSKQTLTVAKNDPQVGQVRRIWERVVTASRKLGVTAKMFQAALAYPGTELEDGIVAMVVRLAKKATGIVTPRRATETGLIPAGWSVKSDQPEAEVNLAQLDYDYCPVRAGESYINGDTMLACATEAHAIGSLGLVADLLKAQDEGKEIFPVESRGKHYFIMPLTVLLDDDGSRHVAYFGWDGGRWVVIFSFVGSDFNARGRFVRVRESAAA
jgi:hypothetical protein